jgi:hypothetical protein
LRLKTKNTGREARGKDYRYAASIVEIGRRQSAQSVAKSPFKVIEAKLPAKPVQPATGETKCRVKKPVRISIERTSRRNKRRHFT